MLCPRRGRCQGICLRKPVKRRKAACDAVEETTMWYRTLGGIVTLIVGLLIAPLATAAPPARMARIGWLAVGPPPGNGLLPYFLERLRELGYVEGHHFTIEHRWAEGKPERLPALAAE